MELIFKLQVKIKKRKKYYLSVCPDLDVMSQGHTEKEALHNIKDAVQLFLEGCFEMGTLWKVLSDCGVKPAKIANRRPTEGREISVPLPLMASKHKARVEHCHA